MWTFEKCAPKIWGRRAKLLLRAKGKIQYESHFQRIVLIQLSFCVSCRARDLQKKNISFSTSSV